MAFVSTDYFKIFATKIHHTTQLWGWGFGVLFVSSKSDVCWPWWRHQMETFSGLLAICAGNSPASGEFPAQRPVTRSFDVFFDLRLNKRLSKQMWGWWSETLSCPLWRHCNGQYTHKRHPIAYQFGWVIFEFEDCVVQCSLYTLIWHPHSSSVRVCYRVLFSSSKSDLWIAFTHHLYVKQ